MTTRAGMSDRPAFTPVRPGLLQRQCSCGGAGAECEECGKKRKLLQRSASGPTHPSSVPSSVHRTLQSPGVPLDSGTRGFMESQFGHSFSHVRVHHDATAAESARAVNANAYTVGRDVVFASGRYAPQTQTGRELLAHELAHVVQQRGTDESGPPADLRIAPAGSNAPEAEAEAASARVARGSGTAPPMKPHAVAVQRQEAGEDKKPQAPVEPATPQMQVQPDPAIQATAMAQQTYSLLDPAYIRLTISKMDMNSILTAPQPTGMIAGPSLPSPQDLVPRGAGPSMPRVASGGDVVSALLKIPAVDSTLSSLQNEAASKLKTDWLGLSTKQKIAVVSGVAVISGSALAGVLSNSETRQYALDVLQDKNLPTGVPGLNFQFSAAGAEHHLRFNLNLGHFLPKQWGFY